MKIGTVLKAFARESLWLATLVDWQNDAPAGRVLLQVRGTEQRTLWEVVEERGDDLVLQPTGHELSKSGLPTKSTLANELVSGDELVFAGGVGLGDLIARMTSAIGIQPCGGCKSRQATLNKLFPNVLKR